MPAHQLGVGGQDADLLAPAARDDANRSRQLILDRQTAVEERNHHFLGARGEGDAQEDLVRHLLALVVAENTVRLDAESLLGLPRLLGKNLGRHQVQPDLAAALRLVFLEQPQQVGLDLDVLARHLGTDKCLHQHRPVGRDVLGQLERLGRERVQLLPARVAANAKWLDNHGDARDRDDHRQEPHRRMQPVVAAGLTAGPVPPAQEHHVQVEHRRRQAHEVKQPVERDHTRPEILKLRGDRPSLKHTPSPVTRERADVAQEDRDSAEHAPRMKATVTFDESSRRDHRQRDQKHAHQPVARDTWRRARPGPASPATQSTNTCGSENSSATV